MVPNPQQTPPGGGQGERDNVCLSWRHLPTFSVAERLVGYTSWYTSSSGQQRTNQSKKKKISLAHVPLSEMCSWSMLIIILGFQSQVSGTTITKCNTRHCSCLHQAVKHQHLCHPPLRQSSGACSNASHSGDVWSPLSWVKHLKENTSQEGTHQLLPQPFILLAAW